MKPSQIEAEFNAFFEFPTDDKSQVSSVSCKLFAKYIADMALAQQASESEKCHTWVCGHEDCTSNGELMDATLCDCHGKFAVEPQQSEPAKCDECDKSQSDGFALYCVECIDMIEGKEKAVSKDCSQVLQTTNETVSTLTIDDHCTSHEFGIESSSGINMCVKCGLTSMLYKKQSEPAFITREQIAQEIESQIDGSKNSLFRSGMKISADIVRTEPSQVSQPVASVIKGGADRHFMSENMRSLPDGLHQLYAEPPDYEALKARVAELEGIAIRTDEVITETTENVIQIIAERDKLQSELISARNQALEDAAMSVDEQFLCTEDGDTLVMCAANIRSMKVEL